MVNANAISVLRFENPKIRLCNSAIWSRLYLRVQSTAQLAPKRENPSPNPLRLPRSSPQRRRSGFSPNPKGRSSALPAERSHDNKRPGLARGQSVGFAYGSPHLNTSPSFNSVEIGGQIGKLLTEIEQSLGVGLRRRMRTKYKYSGRDTAKALAEYVDSWLKKGEKAVKIDLHGTRVALVAGALAIATLLTPSIAAFGILASLAMLAIIVSTLQDIELMDDPRLILAHKILSSLPAEQEVDLKLDLRPPSAGASDVKRKKKSRSVEATYDQRWFDASFDKHSITIEIELEQNESAITHQVRAVHERLIIDGDIVMKSDSPQLERGTTIPQLSDECISRLDSL